MRDGFLRLRLNEGAIKARVKSDTSANNWPMNAQFFFSSYVTCHATSWTRTPSGDGSRGTTSLRASSPIWASEASLARTRERGELASRLGYYRQVAATAIDHSVFESMYRSGNNCKLPQHVAATPRSNKSLRVYWRNFVKIFVFATEFCRRDKSHKILSDLIFCNLLLRQNSVAENPKIL